MRVLGIDYGDKRVGIAVSDSMNIIAKGIEIWENRRDLYTKIKNIVEEYEVGTVVVGMPLNMNGSKGYRAEITSVFVEKLKKMLREIRIVTWDERLSTRFSLKVLSETSVKRNKKKKIVDKVAATFILQGYLDSIR
ncbi:MAG: Holliday junction resolvase RuvX [Deltaproteobacteria bacterium]|nr:Holliday junction resolvase RuvX [Deltaproteobacteria bacterium]